MSNGYNNENVDAISSGNQSGRTAKLWQMFAQAKEQNTEATAVGYPNSVWDAYASHASYMK